MRCPVLAQRMVLRMRYALSAMCGIQGMLCFCDLYDAFPELMNLHDAFPELMILFFMICMMPSLNWDLYDSFRELTKLFFRICLMHSLIWRTSSTSRKEAKRWYRVRVPTWLT